MAGNVFSQTDLRKQQIMTTEYEFNLTPGVFAATLNMMAEGRSCLRLFFSFDDERKVIATVYWWQGYLGFYDAIPGSRFLLTYKANGKGAVYLIQAEKIPPENS